MEPQSSIGALLNPSTWWGVGWGVVLLHTAGSLLALHALMRRQSPQGTLAWMLALTLAPALSIPFYLVLGFGFIRRRRRRRRLPRNSERLLLERGIRWQKSAEGIEKPLARLSGMLPCCGNSIRLMEGNRSSYHELGREIAQARESILLEFFIIKNDRAGTRLRQLLEERAAHGVDVYVIYDEIGSYKLPPGYLLSLKRAGVHVASFNGRRYWWSSILRLNYRNHRKLVIIDGKVALIGSLNVGIEYMHLNKAPYWRDSFVRLEGPIISQAQLSFADDWHHATHEDISARLARQPICKAGEEICLLLPSGPDNRRANVWQTTLLELIESARQRLWLASPYFVPDAAVTMALKRAALRGVDVRLMLPQKSDNSLAQLAMLTYLPGLFACGVRILAYTPGFLHEKAALVDEACSCIGTANLDERSLSLNFELTLLMRGSSMARQIATMLEKDMKLSVPLTRRTWQEASLPRKLAARLCRLLSPVL